jgi:hypothetical protein
MKALMFGFIAMRVAACAQVGQIRTEPQYAQPAFDAFAPLGSPLACRELPLKQSDSAAASFEFVDAPGPQIERRLIYKYDATGAPLHGGVTASAEYANGPGWAEMIIMRFRPTPVGTRIHTQTPSNGAPVPVDTTVKTASLAEVELKKAEALGRWTWDHRCSNDRGKQ